ncbi:response regulator transcription factor [Ruminococcaceae bacterium OttesenSCG-928-A11]|nr:response regulator transcription factor [Ruminococcaceae bacterium OttesenSCG-928-A11]
MRVLLVEDEKHLAQPLAQLLREKHYEVDCVYDGRDGLDWGLSGSYDAIILDIMLPRMDGLEVLGELRRAGISTPVLMLTARGEERDVVTGLDRGADDYLPKPFSAQVLMARLRSITRRKGDLQTRDGALCCGDARLSMDALTLSTSQKSVSISLKEALVMEHLMRNAPMVCDKGAIIVSAWGHESDTQDNNVEVYISFLRKKLAHIGASCRIETVRGVGYRMESGHV